MATRNRRGHFRAHRTGRLIPVRIHQNPPGQDPPRAQAHPLAVAENPREPVPDTTAANSTARCALRPIWPPPGPGAGDRTSTPSTTSTPAPHPSTCDAGATARNAPTSNPSRTSSPWSKYLGWHHRLACQTPEQRPAQRGPLPDPRRQSRPGATAAKPR
jgi:hypothetical protein